MNNHRYTLEAYKGPGSRYTCPSCGMKHQLVRYVDTETNMHLADYVGRCNREHQCGYHVPPKDFFADNPQVQMPPLRNRNNNLRELKPVSYMPLHVLDESMALPQATNHFICFLALKFGWDNAKALARKYRIGTSYHWDSSTVFWQTDTQGRIRTGKVILYDPTTGKRLKQDGRSFVTWMHSTLRYDNFNLKQCLFGEHLLAGNTLPVAVAESEKSAIIASLFMPEYVWLAAGSMQNLSPEKLQVCKGRQIVLVPDAGAYTKWAAIAKQVPNCKVLPIVDNLFTTEEQQQGYDIADYLLNKMAG